MEQLTLSKWLKGIDILALVMGSILYFYVVPIYIRENTLNIQERNDWFWPWMMLVWIVGIPCYLSLIEFYKIAREIGKNNSFSLRNIKCLNNIAKLSIIDVCILFIGNIILFSINMNNLVILSIMIFIMVMGTAISVASLLISHLIYKAYKLKEENDLTI